LSHASSPKFLIHFELILVQGGKHGFCFGFLQADIHFPSNVY
jgi:hypothetical protein